MLVIDGYESGWWMPTMMSLCITSQPVYSVDSCKVFEFRSKTVGSGQRYQSVGLDHIGLGSDSALLSWPWLRCWACRFCTSRCLMYESRMRLKNVREEKCNVCNLIFLCEILSVQNFVDLCKKYKVWNNYKRWHIVLHCQLWLPITLVVLGHNVPA